MTKEQVAELLKDLTLEGIYLTAVPSEYSVRPEWTPRSVGPSPALRSLLKLHKWEVHSYLTLHGGPSLPSQSQDMDVLLDGLRERLITVTTDGTRLYLTPWDAPMTPYERAGLKLYESQLVDLLAIPSYTTARNVPSALRDRIIQFHDFTCQYCRRVGTTELDPDHHAWHVDHVRPLSLGGSNDPSNLTLACMRCNLMKGSQDIGKFLEQATATL